MAAKDQKAVGEDQADYVPSMQTARVGIIFLHQQPHLVQPVQLQGLATELQAQSKDLKEGGVVRACLNFVSQLSKGTLELCPPPPMHTGSSGSSWLTPSTDPYPCQPRGNQQGSPTAQLSK